MARLKKFKVLFQTKNIFQCNIKFLQYMFSKADLYTFQMTPRSFKSVESFQSNRSLNVPITVNIQIFRYLATPTYLQKWNL